MLDPIFKITESIAGFYRSLNFAGRAIPHLLLFDLKLKKEEIPCLFVRKIATNLGLSYRFLLHLTSTAKF